MMKIVVVGLGSMGKRRIRLISENFPEVEIFGVDTNEKRRSEVTTLFSITCYAELNTAVETEGIGTVFVCTSPLSHEVIIKEAIELNCNVFTEINLLNNYYQEVLREAKQRDVKLYISSTFLKRKEVQYIIDSVKSNKELYYQYHVGQYLPDWHPWEDYRDFFVSNPLTNGCREIMAIELPWIIKAFGEIISFSVKKGKVSQLDIDYPDFYVIQIEHETGIKGTFNVDIVSRIAKRDLIIVREQDQIEWDGTPFGLTQWNNITQEMSNIDLYEQIEQNENYSRTIIEDAYFEEIKEFFAYIESDKPVDYSFEEDMRVIDIINKIEE